MVALAKLTRPTLHQVVHRERVYDQIDNARSRPLVWVTAPPGAGKTTAIASYIAANKVRALWYQVDTGDQDVASFFYYLSVAAYAQGARRKQDLPLLTPEYQADVSTYARHFFRLFFSRLKRPAMLVLDNYHELPKESVLHALLEHAVAEVPGDINLLVISRMEPPPECARLEASDKLSRIGNETLRLTVDETRDIVGLRYGVDEGLVTELHTQSDGWAAGLTLTLERMKRHGKSLEEIRQDAQESVFDYFAGQIMKGTDPDVRDFLMRTALLPRMSAKMALQLSGNPNAARLLDEFYRRRLFIDRRGDEYQYHDLFRAYLLAQVEQVYTELGQRELRARAGSVLEEVSQFPMAIALFAEALEWDSVVRILLSQAESLLSQGRGETLRQWIGLLPPEIRATNAWVDYWLGMSLIGMDPIAARKPLECAFHRFDDACDRLGALLAASSVVLAYFFEYACFTPLDAWATRIENLIRFITDFQSPAVELHAYAALLCAQVHRKPDAQSIEITISRIGALMESDIAPDAKMLVAPRVLHYLYHSQQVARASPYIGRIDALIEHEVVAPISRWSWLLSVGWCWTDCFEPHSARRAYEAGLAVGRSNGLSLPTLVELSYIGLAWTALQCGDTRAAEAYLANTAQVYDLSRPVDAWLGQTVQGLILLEQGDTQKGLAALQAAHQAALHTGVTLFEFYGEWILAAGLIEAGRYDEADCLLRKAGEWVASTAYSVHLCAVEYVEAYSALCRGNGPACAEVLHRALTRAKASGYRMFILVCRPLVRRLLAFALREDIEPIYVRGLIRSARLEPPARESTPWPWPIEIRTLGRFEILLDERPIEFGRKSPRKPLQLLKAIVAFGGTEVPAQKLIDALWPDLTPSSARQALDMTVIRLRRLLGDATAVVQAGGRFGIDTKCCWIDALAFECRRSLIQDETSSEPGQTAAEILTLYRGNFLEDDGDAPWLIPVRERLRSRFIECVSTLGGRCEERHDFVTALALYRRGIEADELAEPFYRGMMRCYAARKSKAEAMSVFRRLRQTLSVTLGIAPSPESLALFESLRT